MDIYLNDWSLNEPSAKLSSNWSKINQFNDLRNCLKKYGLSKTIAPSNLNDLLFCGIKFKQFYTEKEIEGLSMDKIKQVVHILWSFSKYTDDFSNNDNGMMEFHHPSNESIVSQILGKAYQDKCPTISFTFNTLYAKPYIDGYISENQSNTVQIPNFYEASHILDYPYHLIPWDKCKDIDPLENPLWNIIQTRQYMESYESEFTKVDSSTKEALISRHSRKVAELNGWELDRQLTSLNKQKSNSLRLIFRSKHFKKRTNIYLSADFEKPNVYFELHNHNGKHIKEIKWDGTLSGEEDTTGKHNLKMCK